MSENEIEKEKANKDKKIKLKRIKLKRNKDKKIKLKENNKVEKIDKVNKPKKQKRKIVWKIFKITFFVGLALFIVGACVVLAVLHDIISETSTVDFSQLKNLKLTTTILDSTGEQLGTVNSGENRLLADYEDLPKHLVDAIVAIEDERFWTHFGIDIKRTGGAIVSFVINRGNSDFGGSTITQQLVKNITEDNETSWKRKIREWYRAIMLEKDLEKEDILEAYLNKIYFGAGANGIEMAAETYFAKSTKELNLAESACLAASIQLPERTNPYNGDEYKERLIARQKIVLAKMLEIGKITKAEYDEAIAYELVFEKGEIASTATVQSYARDAVWKAVAEDLAEAMGITYEVARDMIASNGYTIYSTIDPKVQASIDKQAANTKYFYKENNGDMMQCAMIVLDNKTGNVVGLLGGVGEKTGLDYNRATESRLQPGSTFKPIASYGPAFELGESYPGMGIDDAPININGYRPGNWYGYYYGYVSARYAINQSMNIPAVKTLASIDLDYALRFAQNMGITTLTSNNKNLSLALGSANVKIIDMAAAYATMANGGVYTEPKLYTKVLDHDGNEILKTEVKFTKVMSATTAYMLTDCLVDVVKTGTGTHANFSNAMDIAGKTGNTDEDKDQWFAGYTTYYTAVVWNGYDNPRRIGYRNTLGTYPYTSTAVFTNVMKEIHSGLKATQFTKPKGIVNATICTVSGLVATDACKADTRAGIVRSEIFASGTVPTEKCTIHKQIDVCAVSKLIPTEFCELYEEGLESISFITRSNPDTKTSDKNYVMPTKKCEIHTSAPVIEPEDPIDPENPEQGQMPGGNEGESTEQGGGNSGNAGTDNGNTEPPEGEIPGDNTEQGGENSGGTGTENTQPPSGENNENGSIYSRILCELYKLA